jgi:hypothetical protein
MIPIAANSGVRMEHPVRPPLPPRLLTPKGNGEKPLGREWQLIPKSHCRWCICAGKIATMLNLIEFAAYAILTLGNLIFVRVLAMKVKLPNA